MSQKQSQPDELDLLQEIDAALDGHPLDLLAHVSSLLAVVDLLDPNPFEPHQQETPTLEDLVTSFLEVDLRQTTALLYGFAALVDNDLLAARIRRELAGRSDDLPAWLRQLGDCHVYRTMEMRHVLGDGDNLILGARLPTGEKLTAMVYVDHNVGTLVKDAFALPEAIDAVQALYVDASDNDPDTTYTDIDPAEARAKVTDAIATAAMTHPPFESDSWPMCRPLVQWLVRMLPGGGRGYEPPEWSEADQQGLAADFFASPFGSPVDNEVHRSLLEAIVWFGCDYAGGDPLRWSSVRVEVLLADWLPRKVMGEPANLDLVPRLLAAFIRYCHDRLGIRPQLTEETLAAVDQRTPEYLRAVRRRTPGDVLAAVLRDAGVPVDDAWSWEDWMLESLDAQVGGRDALTDLDDAPLPDEPFDWTAIAADVHPAVAEVLALVDAGCEQLFDVEARTACRRLLRRAAVGDPNVFRRRAKAETAAAAICWAVGTANGLFFVRSSHTQVLVRDVQAFFGIGGSPSQRASTLLRAAGIAQKGLGAVALGTPDLLVGPFRRQLITRRDRLWATEADRRA